MAEALNKISAVSAQAVMGSGIEEALNKISAVSAQAVMGSGIEEALNKISAVSAQAVMGSGIEEALNKISAGGSFARSFTAATEAIAAMGRVVNSDGVGFSDHGTRIPWVELTDAQAVGQVGESKVPSGPAGVVSPEVAVVAILAAFTIGRLIAERLAATTSTLANQAWDSSILALHLLSSLDRDSDAGHGALVALALALGLFSAYGVILTIRGKGD